MKKTLALMLLTAFLCMEACNRLTPENVEASVIEGTRKQVPLLVQQLMIIDTITVDSLNLMVNTEPMSGLLYTTWTVGSLSTPVIVNVTDIKKSQENKGCIVWQADWESAAKAFLMKSMFRELPSPSL